MNEEIKPENMRIHSRADELIACLEGEIAKRDEELAACRVAVENCDLFRARIVELEHRCGVYGLELHDATERLQQAERQIKAIKAQVPVGFAITDDDTGKLLPHAAFFIDRAKAEKLAALTCGCSVAPLYAAPVSEAKAQGVVMPERWNVPRPMWKDVRQPYGNPLNHADIEAAEKFNLALDEVARLNSAPVQQVSVPDGWKLVPVEPTPEMVCAAEEAHMPFGDMDIALRMAILSAPSAPAAPVADAGVITHD